MSMVIRFVVQMVVGAFLFAVVAAVAYLLWLGTQWLDHQGIPSSYRAWSERANGATLRVGRSLFRGFHRWRGHQARSRYHQRCAEMGAQG